MICDTMPFCWMGMAPCNAGGSAGGTELCHVAVAGDGVVPWLAIGAGVGGGVVG